MCIKVRTNYIHFSFNISKAFVILPLSEDNHKIIVLDVTTQAGTYIKEMVHGEFGRTQPSICSIIGQEIDIVTLDVVDIDLDWPKEVVNISVSTDEN